MVIEFVKPWAHYSIGQTIDAPEGQADLMIQRGWCKKHEEKPQPQVQKPKQPKQ